MFDAILHPFAWAISWLWVWIHDFLVLVGMSSGSGIAWVLSIVLLTILVRIAIIPLFLKQIRSSRAMQAIQPEMRKIQEKYKGKKDQVSRQKMMEETQALQRKHKVSPFASCLPMLVQMPVLFGMYRARKTRHIWSGLAPRPGGGPVPYGRVQGSSPRSPWRTCPHRDDATRAHQPQ